jgi:type IX secretion system PorP/SprF family membrane protein
MKKIIIILLTVVFTISVKAQQDPQYTQYMYNMSVLNPAYAGSYNSLSINILGRSQWVGIPGAPKTLALAISAPVGKSVGLGLSVTADEIGPIKEQNIYGDFSYTLKIGEKTNLALGLKAGVTFLNINLNNLRTLNENDPAFLNQNPNKSQPNFGVGAFYYTDKFYAGLSIPHLLQTTHFKQTGNKGARETDISHFFLTSGYVFNISKDIKLKPSILAKVAQGVPASIDFSGNVLVFDKLEFGVSYRLDESISALINIRASRSLRVGYAYDHTLTNVGEFNSGSHEVFVLFNFDFERYKIRSPRFF